MRPVLLLLLLSVGLPAWGQAPDFAEDFEQGTGGAQSYFQAPDALTIARVRGEAAAGQHFLRAALPGKRALEGFWLAATGLTGARVATVTAQVRGRGEFWLCLYSRNGWLYSPETQRLTDQWQRVTLSKALTADDERLGIYFLSRTAQEDALFEVDDVRVTLAPAPQTFPAAVGPWRLEAEAFIPHPAAVTDEPQASAGQALRDARHVIAAGMPFPRTRHPVTVYARVWTSHAEDRFALLTWQGGVRQAMRTARPRAQQRWEWIAFPPVVAGEVGDDFGVCSQREAAARGDVRLDCVVLATTEGLSAEQLAAAPALLDARPLAQVNRLATPPVIDGRPDDPCWQQTVACTGFMGLGTTTAADAPTTVRLGYDATHLYALFACQEPVLSTAQQRRHEFIARVTQRDGDVYADDAVALLLDPTREGKRICDFAVNALGTVVDALAVAPDWWGSRDTGWNTGARAAGTQGEGQWFVEIAIPFADLGGAPRPGDRWEVVLGRLATCRKEVSTWNPCGRGIHDPTAPGVLVFGSPGPGLDATSPHALQAGKNHFSVAVSGPSPTGLLLFTHLRHSAASSSHVSYFPGDPGQAAQEFTVPGESQVRLAHAVFDAATLTPLYQTPEVSRSVQSSQALLRLRASGPYALFLNGERVAEGERADGTTVPLPLRQGANVLTLRLQQGTAALRGQVGDFQFDATGWRLVAADHPRALDPEADDAEWPLASRIGADPELGPVVGQMGKPVVLRRVVLSRHTRVWPTPEPAYYLARGIAQQITFVVRGLPSRPLRGWQTYLAVPPELTVLGCTGFYGGTPGVPRYTCTLVGERTIGGRVMRVVRIRADQPLVVGQHYILSEFEVFVRYREAAGAPKAPEARFVYWSEANNGSVIEPPREVPVRLLPKVNGAQCRKLVWQLWGSWLSSMNSRALRTAVLQTARQAGFNDLVGGDRWLGEHAPRYGLRHTLEINFEPWSLGLQEFLKRHPAQRLVRADGKPAESWLCPTLLLGEGWGAARARLAARLKETRPQTVEYDYEYDPFTGPHSCYCARCLRAFRQAAGLDAAVKLDAATIRAAHAPAWIDFMARRVARIMRRFKETVHELAPGTQFSIYSGYQTPDNPERYGINWHYLGDERACDRAGCGYGRPVEAITATLAALRGIPLVGGLLVTPYDREVLVPASPLTKAWLLRTLLDSTGGVLVYERTSLDGRSWLAVGETTRLVARYEAAFLHGKRLPLARQDPAQVQQVRYGNLTLVCLMNGTGRPLNLKVALPAELGGGREYYRGRAVRAGAVVTALLAPGEAEVLVLRRSTPDGGRR
ncbi:MAG: hypothetical protein GX774_07515 [Armatimonadetes bacterium]|nr:hypothetical protein [Armatimonadota bacterium]